MIKKSYEKIVILQSSCHMLTFPTHCPCKLIWHGEGRPVCAVSQVRRKETENIQAGLNVLKRKERANLCDTDVVSIYMLLHLLRRPLSLADCMRHGRTAAGGRHLCSKLRELLGWLLIVLRGEEGTMEVIAIGTVMRVSVQSRRTIAIAPTTDRLIFQIIEGLKRVVGRPPTPRTGAGTIVGHKLWQHQIHTRDQTECKETCLRTSGREAIWAACES